MMIILLILLIFVFSYREVLHLIERGSWQAIDHLPIYWFTDWKSFWKLFDSFHVSNGLITLIIIVLIKDKLFKFKFIKNQLLSDALHITAYWLVWMQIRNLFMVLI